MALKDIWRDLVNSTNGIDGDDASVEPINDIAHAVIELEKTSNLTNFDYATNDKAGVVKVSSDDTNGIKIDENGVLYLQPASEEDILLKRENAAITSSNFDAAIRIVGFDKFPSYGEYQNLYFRVEDIENNIGDIDTALDAIIQIQVDHGGDGIAELMSDGGDA